MLLVLFFHKKHRQQLFQVNVEGTANVVNACLKAGVRKLVHEAVLLPWVARDSDLLLKPCYGMMQQVTANMAAQNTGRNGSGVVLVKG
jgi:hypothetical protein